MKLTLRLLCTTFLLLWSLVTLANGKVTHLSGQVSLKKADGSVSQVSPGVTIVQGDTLLTGANGFVRMETADGGEFVLRPNSEFVMEKYNYDKDKPEEDSFVYSMVKGGLRTVTGLIGKRGNKDAYLGKTPTAVIGIRGTFFELRVCADDCGSLPNGTYLSLRSGSIVTGNAFGNLTMTPGQIVFVAPNAAPKILPRDPGIGFTTPQEIPKPEEKKQQDSKPADSNSTTNNTGTGTAPANGGQDGPSCTII